VRRIAQWSSERPGAPWRSGDPSLFSQGALGIQGVSLCIESYLYVLSHLCIESYAGAFSLSFLFAVARSTWAAAPRAPDGKQWPLTVSANHPRRHARGGSAGVDSV
jgi:hypothetical protein